jgi:hypothetical protein
MLRQPNSLIYLQFIIIFPCRLIMYNLFSCKDVFWYLRYGLLITAIHGGELTSLCLWPFYFRGNSMWWPIWQDATWTVAPPWARWRKSEINFLQKLLKSGVRYIFMKIFPFLLPNDSVLCSAITEGTKYSPRFIQNLAVCSSNDMKLEVQAVTHRVHGETNIF